MKKRRPIPTADGAFMLTKKPRKTVLHWYRVISLSASAVIVTCLALAGYFYWIGNLISYQSLVQSATIIALIFLSSCPLFVNKS